MRIVTVHAYFSIDWDLIWETSLERVPTLRAQIAVILASEFPDDETPTPKE